jgi:hypothetical protein
MATRLGVSASPSLGPQRGGIECNSDRQGFPETTQGIHFLHELGKIDQFAVGRQVGFDDQATRPLRGLNHLIAGQDPHPPNERIQIDQLRNLGFVADKRVGVESGGFLDEASIEPLALGN